VKGRALDLVVGFGLVCLVGAWALGTASKSDVADKKAEQASIAKRVADAIATRNPTIMRELAAQLEAEGYRDAADGLRMAADLADQLPSPQYSPTREGGRA
jgi:hypothetical protein